MEVTTVLEYLEYPLDYPSKNRETSREIISYVLDSYVEQVNQSSKTLDLTIPVDDLLQDRFFKSCSIDEDIFNFKKTEVLKLIDSILINHEEIIQGLTKLQSNIEKL